MIKRIVKFLLFLIIILIIIISYLSIFGINTKKFNNKIKNEVLNINKKINLELKNVELLLNPFNFSINIKTFGPDVFIDNHQLRLKYIKTNISLKSFINKEFSIDNLQITTKKIKLNDIILGAKSYKNSAELFILGKIIKDGFLIGNINLNFDSTGKIKKDYEINGLINDGKLSLLNKHNINNLNLVFEIKDKEYFLKDIKTDLNEIKLSSPLIKIKKKNNKFSINGKLISNNKEIDIKLLKNLLGGNTKTFGIEKINFNSDTNFNFTINKKLRISNIDLKSTVNLNQLNYYPKLENLKKYLPNHKEFIELKNHKVSINYQKNKLEIKGKGLLSIGNKVDDLEYELNRKNNDYTFNISAILEKNSILFNALNYKKVEDLYSNLNLSGSYKKNKEINFDLISFADNNKNVFIIRDLNLDKKFNIDYIDKLNLNFTNNNKIKNQISLKRNKDTYTIEGKSFDATVLIDDILNGNNEEESSSLFSNLNSNFNINIDKTYLDKVSYIKNLNGNINFENNKINKLNLDSIFPNKKKLTLTINTNENNEKITTLFSGYPKPLIKQYKFIKGFEEGVLDFYSIKKKDTSSSVLKIDNFKVQEVPVLAKLLTLASLQGIADLLTGEGIRFTDFEMKFSNKKGLMTIDEMYAIGPAISVLMDGYVVTKKLISLRGTLVPATTINKSIASIPLIGKILVGEKTGEGVFGVSFKIKGPPKDIKTTVNPIKTLTPRFITRTLEKINKN